jgi:uncharacterized protein (UPF0332 family)
MPYPADLLEQAWHLAKREKKKPRQASLRRAVSTAYYALFHLLIHEATLNWRRVDQRALFARFFEHGKMRNASKKQADDLNAFFKTNPPAGHKVDSALHLHRVANTFSKAQEQRHTAEYDSAAIWSRTEVISLIELVDSAFKSWHTIREESPAQTYLISLLGNPRG